MNRAYTYRRLLRNNISAGIDVFINTDGTCLYSLCVSERKKKEVKILKSLTDISDITELHIEQNIPVYISISGKGILHKKTEYAAEADDSWYISTVLPGDASYKDFYVQLSPVYSGFVYVSIARKQMIDEVISKLEESNIQVLNCSLGPFVIHHLLEGMTESNGSFYELYIPHHFISISNNQIIEYQTTKEAVSPGSETLSVNGQEIARENTLSFSLSLQHFIKSFSISIADPGIQNRQTTFSQQRIFHLSYPVITCVLIILIAGLLFIKNSLNNKKQHLLYTLSAYENDLLQYDTLISTFNNKKDFIENSGMNRLSRSSFYIDRLLTDVPHGIQLTEVNYCPAKKSLSNDSVIKYTVSSVIVAGNCEQSAILNDWMKNVKKKNFIKEVRLENYKQDKQSSKGEFLFTATIEQ